LSGNDQGLFVRLVLSIRKLGFKPWFERQLIESHVYLVTCFLCLILVLAIFEELSSRSGVQRVAMIALATGSVALGIFSWGRYRVILFRALRFSERSYCEKCRAYARFNVLDSARAEEDDSGAWLKVRCRECTHEWTIT
jgi:hypothetical protein